MEKMLNESKTSTQLIIMTHPDTHLSELQRVLTTGLQNNVSATQLDLH